MAGVGRGNLQKLIDAGVVVGELPRPHEAVVEGLTKQEVEVIIAVKKRLEAADEWADAPPAAPGEIPHYVSLIRF
jgi:hypothetical protein